MLRKYGSPEAMHQQMVEMGKKGGKSGNTGGFASRRDLAVTAGRLGGKKSRRGKGLSKFFEEHGEEIYAKYKDGKAVSELAREYDLNYGTLRTRINKMEMEDNEAV
jgi:Mor family transcriptional regulator